MFLYAQNCHTEPSIANFAKPLLALRPSFLFWMFVVIWFLSWCFLGGSFAKFGFSVGLCGFANVPPNG